MTPAERARQIDKEEFAAECASLRQRAYAVLGIKPKPEQRVRRWVKREEPKTVYRPFVVMRPRVEPRQPQLHTVQGISLTSRQWAERLGISNNAMHQRIHRHGSVVAAILKHIELNGPAVLLPREQEGTE